MVFVEHSYQRIKKGNSVTDYLKIDEKKYARIGMPAESQEDCLLSERI